MTIWGSDDGTDSRLRGNDKGGGMTDGDDVWNDEIGGMTMEQIPASAGMTEVAE